ncbi:aldolase/citrate lyase family protein [Desulfobacterales bacterium HSG2]|nr:aldolase/citrate lyase family protein [Desulfobacterales bacterium HSG2]
MKASFKKRLTRGDLLIGTIITLPSPEIAEIFCLAGFDWLFVDLEHSALSIKDAQVILQAASKIPCVIRVASGEEVWIKKALDIGASGIIVPQIRTTEEAEMSVRLCKYPPEGIRSVGISRAQQYGQNFQEYVASANDETAVIIQIEHIDAVNDIENILGISGIDGLFVGPYDLSASMGKTGHITDTEVQNAILHVKNCAERAKIPLGIFGATAEAVNPYIRSGYTLIAVCMDTMLIGNAAKNITDLLKSSSG